MSQPANDEFSQHLITAAEIQDVEKERKAKNILLMAILKEHMRRFHGMDDAKEIWEVIRTRFGGEHTVEEEESNHVLVAISSSSE
ncbi:hypothetical protein Tco_1525195, partial [Tanacetum coccineum]